MQTCVTQTLSSTLSLTQTFPSCSFPVDPSPHSSRGNHYSDFFQHILVLLVLEPLINGIIKYLLLYNSFTQYSFLRLGGFGLFHVVYKSSLSFLLLSSIHCLNNQIFIHSLVDGLLGHFKFLFIMNNAIHYSHASVFVIIFLIFLG